MKSRITFTGMAIISMVYFSHATHPGQRPIQIKNESGQTTEIYWVDPSSGAMVLQAPNMANGQSLNLNSYVNHTFLVRELPDESGTCNAGTTYASPSLAPCKTALITVNDHDDQSKQVCIIIVLHNTCTEILFANILLILFPQSNSHLARDGGGS